MRNLKRALSLALTAVMVLGMMVIGAGAVSYDDFSDKDKIVNTEAVSTLVELGVIAGKDDGSYDPSGIVTRAEMAKMICVVLNGGKDPQLGTVSTYTYSDTVTSWASAYIEYCTTLGIVAGDGTGKFNPTATVTGAQAAKMLLVAAGYQAAIQGYTGNNWANAVNVDANTVGLYDDLSINPSAGLTRDDAAQMVYNALDAKMVTYDYTLVSDGKGGFTSIPTLKDDSSNKTILESKFNAVKVEGVVVANEYANLNTSGSTMDEGKTKIQITNGDDQDVYTGTPTFSVSTGLDQLGRSVIMYVKSGSNSSKATVFGGVILSDDNKVVTDYTSDKIADVADDNDLNVLSSTQVAVNYGDAENYSAYSSGEVGTAGVEKILIDNDDDGDLDYVLMNSYYFGKVTSYTTSGDGSITVSTKDNTNSYATLTLSKSDKDDVKGFDSVAKNDYVLAAYIGGDLYVTKADSVTGTLEAYKGTSPVTKLTVDGTTYKVSAVGAYTGGSDDIKAAKDYGVSYLDNDATFYLDKGGYIIAVGSSEESAYNYALVMATGSTIDSRVKVALSDGSTGTYDLNDSGNGLGLNDLDVGSVYAYSINSNKEIKLTAATGDEGLVVNSFTKGKTSIVYSTSQTAYATKSTAFFYVDSSDATLSAGAFTNISSVDTYTGYSSAPTLSGATSHSAIYTSGTRVVAVLLYGSDLASTNVDDNLYLTSIGTSTTDYTNGSAFIAGDDGLKDIKLDTTYTKDAPYTYTINSDGYYELKNISAFTGTTGNMLTNLTVEDVNSDTVVLKASNGTYYELALTSDTMVVDDSAYLDDPTASVGGAPSEGDVISYVVFSLDNGTPDEATMIVVANP